MLEAEPVRIIVEKRKRLKGMAQEIERRRDHQNPDHQGQAYLMQENAAFAKGCRD